jgi:hypothetical protein
MATSKTEETKSNKKKGRNVVTKDKGEKKKKQTNDEHSDDDNVEEYDPTNEEDNEESETEDEEELSESEELQSEEDESEDGMVSQCVLDWQINECFRFFGGPRLSWEWRPGAKCPSCPPPPSVALSPNASKTQMTSC